MAKELLRILFENLVISDKCKTAPAWQQSRKVFENLVISDKCKTEVVFESDSSGFENLVISDKCKTLYENWIKEC